MRAAIVLSLLILMACTDRPSDAGLNRPPPSSPPEKRMNVLDSIDAAMKAARAEDDAYSDPRMRQRITDSLEKAQEDRLKKMREERERKP
jgi:hypothetical protein